MNALRLRQFSYPEFHCFLYSENNSGTWRSPDIWALDDLQNQSEHIASPASFVSLCVDRSYKIRTYWLYPQGLLNFSGSLISKMHTYQFLKLLDKLLFIFLWSFEPLSLSFTLLTWHLLFSVYSSIVHRSSLLCYSALHHSSSFFRHSP